MITFLKKHRFKHIVSLSTILFKRKSITIDELKHYNVELSKGIRREDFIPYDKEGNRILNHKPIFKGWTVCDETSDVKTKVAKLSNEHNNYRIYFGTAKGALIVSETNACDDCTYRDLTIFFENKLELA